LKLSTAKPHPGYFLLSDKYQTIIRNAGGMSSFLVDYFILLKLLNKKSIKTLYKLDLLTELPGSCGANI